MYPALTTRKIISSLLILSPSSKSTVCCASVCRASRCFPALSGDSILKPTLSWLLQTNDPGKFDAEISYVAGGMSWQSDYNIVVSDNPKGKTDLLDMVGWITMRNQSGKTFENANIKLMAGDVNKLQPATVTGRIYAAEQSHGR